ncbi:MAG: CHAT domain-containing protein [Bacteroidota bacterium]
MAIKYLDFDLLIEHSMDRYRARVLDSPAGEASAEFQPPFSEGEIDRFFYQIGQTRSFETEQLKSIHVFGQGLYDAVFCGPVRDLLNSSLKQAAEQAAGLRIRLRLADTPELGNLPWEFLYDPAGNHFFSLSVETPVVRYLEVTEPVRPITVEPPLRILAMICGPKDYPKLDVEGEWQNLQESLKNLLGTGLVELRRVTPPTLAALREELRGGGKYHIFHFIGHGIFSKRDQDGFVLVENELHEGRRLSGRDLGTLLHDHRSLRLALLNACEGARAAENDQFAGTAQSLIREGIPAVIAMQFRITDQAALTLADEFYGALADDLPVDAALNEARKAIKTDGNDLEWGTPVLYMRARDGHIFDLAKLAGGARPGPAPAAEQESEETRRRREAEARAAIEAQEKERRKKSELRELAGAVRQKLIDLRELADAPLPARGNPFLFMQPFGLRDHKRFFGRQEIVQELLDRVQANPVTFLDGCGRTSLLQAGLMPALLEQGDLPLLVSLSSEGLAASVKREIVPALETKETLKEMPLIEFCRHVTDSLGRMKQKGKLFILVDQFEALFEQPESARQTFAEEWKACAGLPTVHWLFSVPSGLTYLLNMFKEKVPVNPNLVTAPPLGREEASLVVEQQAALRGVQTDAGVLQTVLEGLAAPGIDPTQLQLVCYMLTGGKGPLLQRWTMDEYQRQGGVGGILEGYLDRTINDLDPAERDPAWELLSTLIDPAERVVSEAELVRRMQALDVDAGTTRRTLKDLQDSHLVEYSAAYRLSSERLRPSIEEWRDKRAALKKAKEEVWRQVRSIGTSALRGLLGGALGFALAYWVLPYPERVPLFKDPTLFFEWTFYNLTLRALVGGAAGFMLMLAMDLIVASLKGKRKVLRVPAAMSAGAVSLALALILHMDLHYLGPNLAAALARAGLQGAAWGLAMGAGALWVMQAKRAVLPKLLAASVGCGVMLALADLLLKGLDIEAPFFLVFLMGLIMPLFLIGSALLGRSSETKGWLR